MRAGHYLFFTGAIYVALCSVLARRGATNIYAWQHKPSTMCVYHVGLHVGFPANPLLMVENAAPEDSKNTTIKQGGRRYQHGPCGSSVDKNHVDKGNLDTTTARPECRGRREWRRQLQRRRRERQIRLLLFWLMV